MKVTNSANRSSRIEELFPCCRRTRYGIFNKIVQFYNRLVRLLPAPIHYWINYFYILRVWLVTTVPVNIMRFAKNTTTTTTLFCIWRLLQLNMTCQVLFYNANFLTFEICPVIVGTFLSTCRNFTLSVLYMSNLLQEVLFNEFISTVYKALKLLYKLARVEHFLYSSRHLYTYRIYPIQVLQQNI